jgi:myo-inositol 2-dehydrogenase/D-chiro-inositol 1-dehydrogenase
MSDSVDHSRLRLLIVGAGRMGQVHLREALACERVRPVAVVDPLVGELGDLRTFVDLDEALDWGEFDAALVAAPSDLHRPLVARLMHASVPVLCEKPLGLTVDDATALAELAERTGVLLRVGYWRRFVPALVELRRRLADGAFGGVSLIEAWQWDREPPSPGFRARSGGIVRDMGVHEIDQIRWLTGEEIEVQAMVAADVVSTDPVEGDPESVALLGRLSGGGIAFVSLGRRHVDGDACWLEVIGTRDAQRADFMYGTGADDVFTAAIRAQLDAFADLVQHGHAGSAAASAATPADAVAALRVLEAVASLAEQRGEP